MRILNLSYHEYSKLIHKSKDSIKPAQLTCKTGLLEIQLRNETLFLLRNLSKYVSPILSNLFLEKNAMNLALRIYSNGEDPQLIRKQHY